MNLDDARKVAQEAREDVGAFGVPRHSTHDLADLVDVLVGEVERLHDLWVEEIEATGTKMLEVEGLARRLEEAYETLRFYADHANNRPHQVVAGSSMSEVDYDHGAKARAALSGGELKDGGEG